MNVTQIIEKVVGKNKTIPKKSIRIEEWLSWYRGTVLGFHNYRIYNGTNYLDCRRKSMQMAKKVCEDWANVLMNEKCDIVLPNNKKQLLDTILQDTNFWVKANQGVERSFALSYGAFVVGVRGIEIGEKTGRIKKDNAQVTVDFVNNLKIHPITIVNKNITECAFVSVNSDTTHVVVHVKDDNHNYVLHNYVLDDQGKIKDYYPFDTKSSDPWFAIIRPNISSNMFTQGMDDEIGMSIYGNSIDTLKALDNKYDGFDLEFVLGRKRMFVSTEAWTVRKGEDGELQRTFDPYDQLFYHLPDNDDGKPLITNKTDDLRFEAYIKAINTELSYLTAKCGMGESYYKFDGESVATATQVISENSEFYRSIQKHQLLLNQALKTITKAIINASDNFTNNPKFGEIDDDEINIQFDDSIIEDKNSEMERDRLDVSAGIMGRVEYRMKWYGEDEDTAFDNVRKYVLDNVIMRYLEPLRQGAITPQKFVEVVYGENFKDKQKMIDYIDEFVNASPQLDMSSLYQGDESGGDDDDKQNKD